MINFDLPVERETFACFSALKFLYDGVETPGLRASLSSVDASRLFDRAKLLSLTHVVSGAIASVNQELFQASQFHKYTELAQHAFKIQRDCWEIVRQELLTSEIDFLILKGLYFLSELYDEEYRYMMNDVDVIVKPREIRRTKEALERASFTQAIISNDGVLQPVSSGVIEEFEAKHYELFPFTRVVDAPHLAHYADTIVQSGIRHPFIVENGKVFVVVEIDIHHNLSNGFSLEDVWSQPTVFGRESLDRALGGTVYEWFLPARFYHEVSVLAESKAKLLADLIVLMKKKEPEFYTAIAMAEKYSMEPSLFYVYRFLKEWVGLPVPVEAIERLYVGSKSKVAYRDFGDFLPKLTRTSVNYRLCLSD